jgi:hypothetical protein
VKLKTVYTTTTTAATNVVKNQDKGLLHVMKLTIVINFEGSKDDYKKLVRLINSFKTNCYEMVIHKETANYRDQ